jgi:flagellar motor switch protein FliN
MEMSDGILSQEEINALLSQTNITHELSIDDFMAPMEQDALGEIGNISLGSSTTALSTLLNQRVQITTPTIAVIEQDRIKEEFPVPHVAVHVDYTVGFRGKNLLVIREQDAKIIANLMMGGDGLQLDPEFSELHLSAVQEAMNQMMGSAATSMSTLFNQKVDISPPSIDIVDFKEKSLEEMDDDIIIKISFRLKVGNLIDSHMMQLLPLAFAKEMVQKILVSNEAAATSHAVTERTESKFEEPISMTTQQPASHANIQKVQFAAFSPPGTVPSQPENLNILYDVPLDITVELGRTELQIRKILELGFGSILELDKLAGEPVDILANHKLIAKGEVVVIEENFGVRITDIVSPIDRLTRMTN